MSCCQQSQSDFMCVSQMSLYSLYSALLLNRPYRTIKGTACHLGHTICVPSIAGTVGGLCCSGPSDRLVVRGSGCAANPGRQSESPPPSLPQARRTPGQGSNGNMAFNTTSCQRAIHLHHMSNSFHVGPSVCGFLLLPCT